LVTANLSQGPYLTPPLFKRHDTGVKDKTVWFSIEEGIGVGIPIDQKIRVRR
jgi:hypothetical protein